MPHAVKEERVCCAEFNGQEIAKRLSLPNDPLPHKQQTLYYYGHKTPVRTLMLDFAFPDVTATAGRRGRYLRS